MDNNNAYMVITQYRTCRTIVACRTIQEVEELIYTPFNQWGKYVDTGMMYAGKTISTISLDRYNKAVQLTMQDRLYKYIYIKGDVSKKYFSQLIKKRGN